MPNDELLVIPAKVQRAIEYFIDSRDVDKAAMLANMEPVDFRAWMKKGSVREMIDRKLELVDMACAELRAKARVLTVDKLDSVLIEILDSKDKKAVYARLKAAELGYKRHGALKERQEDRPVEEAIRPQIYSVLEKTVTLTEQVTQRQIVSGEPQRPSLPRAIPSEILEY